MAARIKSVSKSIAAFPLCRARHWHRIIQGAVWFSTATFILLAAFPASSTQPLGGPLQNPQLDSVQWPESGPFFNTDLLQRGRGTTVFILHGSQLSTCARTLNSASADLQIALTNDSRTASCMPNCIAMQATVPSSVSCGYKTFTVKTQVQKMNASAGGLQWKAGPDLHGRVFVTPNVATDLVADQKAHAFTMSLNATNRTVTSGEIIGGKIQYAGGDLAAQQNQKFVGGAALNSALPSPKVLGGAATNLSGTIELTTSHPNNVQIEASSPSMTVSKGKNASFEFKLKFKHEKANCLNVPVEITARINGGPDNGDKAVARLFILPK